MPDEPPRQTLPRDVRLRSRSDFSHVFKQRLRASDRLITLHVGRSRQAGPARLGISVGRRFGTAVRRNRAKRLIREAFRRMRHELPPGTDWVIVPRPGEEPSVGELRVAIGRLASQLLARLR